MIAAPRPLGVRRCTAAPDGYVVAMLLQALVCSRCATTDLAGADAFANGFWGTLGVLVLPLLFVTAVGALLWRMPLGLGERPL